MAMLPVVQLMAQIPLARPGVANPQALEAAVKKPKEPTTGAAKALTVVFDEDFANGLTGNTPFGAWTTDGPDGAIWQYDTNGPNGDFSNPSTEEIESTTEANGYMIFDSNLSNNGGLSNNRVGFLVSPIMDLTATPDVQLRFEHRFRWCCSSTPGHWVDVSIDGGASWPFRVNVADGAMNDPMTTNWDIGTHTKWIDISSFIAGNASNVAIRFAHEDTDGTGNISHYHWQVDDVQLIATPTYDPQLVLTQYDDFIVDNLVLSGNTVDLEYTIYPFSQLHPLTLKGKIRNGGTADLTNVDFNVTVEDPSSTVIFDQTGTLNSLLRYAVDSVEFNSFTPPATEGDYTVTFTTSIDSTDEHADDNSFAKEFSVSEFAYALDDDAMNGRTSTQSGDEFEMCNKFFIHNEADAYSVSVAFARKPTGSSLPTPHDQLITARIYDGAGNWIAESQEYFIDSADLIPAGQNKMVELLFADPLNLPVDEYLVCVYYAFGGDPVWIATSGLSDSGTSLDARPNVQDAAAQFFIQDNTPMIRLNFDPSVGIAEQDVTAGVGLGQNIPNPATGTTAIPYSLEGSATVRLAVHDVSGKLVLERNEGNKGAGVYRIQLDTNTMPEGVYFYTLTAGTTQLSKRMTVIH